MRHRSVFRPSYPAHRQSAKRVVHEARDGGVLVVLFIVLGHDKTARQQPRFGFCFQISNSCGPGSGYSTPSSRVRTSAWSTSSTASGSASANNSKSTVLSAAAAPAASMSSSLTSPCWTGGRIKFLCKFRRLTHPEQFFLAKDGRWLVHNLRCRSWNTRRERCRQSSVTRPMSPVRTWVSARWRYPSLPSGSAKSSSFQRGVAVGHAFVRVFVVTGDIFAFRIRQHTGRRVSLQVSDSIIVE